MIVHNPLAVSAPSSVENVLFNFLKRRIQMDLNINDRFIDKSEYIAISGKDVLIRAWFHIVLGLLAMLILAVFLYPETFFNLFDYVLRMVRG
jgi:hypothetical protein